tara:strand:+ start:191 stop:796 length:606 start_codon:yes stop_codon:yes gene_type:complete
MKTPADLQREKLNEIVCKVLEGEYLSIQILDVNIKETVGEDFSTISCKYQLSNQTKIETIKGTGNGIVDAFYNGFVDKMGKKYPSLKELRIIDFNLNAEGLKKYKVTPGTGAFVEAHLLIRGGNRQGIVFHSRSRSIATATIKVVCSALECFINSELTYLKLKKGYKDAKKRNRSDLVEKYNIQMVELVNANCYTASVDIY